MELLKKYGLDIDTTIQNHIEELYMIIQKSDLELFEIFAEQSYVYDFTSRFDQIKNNSKEIAFGYIDGWIKNKISDNSLFFLLLLMCNQSTKELSEFLLNECISAHYKKQDSKRLFLNSFKRYHSIFHQAQQNFLDFVKEYDLDLSKISNFPLIYDSKHMPFLFAFDVLTGIFNIKILDLKYTNILSGMIDDLDDLKKLKTALKYSSISLDEQFTDEIIINDDKVYAFNNGLYKFEKQLSSKKAKAYVSVCTENQKSYRNYYVVKALNILTNTNEILFLNNNYSFYFVFNNANSFIEEIENAPRARTINVTSPYNSFTPVTSSEIYCDEDFFAFLKRMRRFSKGKDFIGKLCTVLPKNSYENEYYMLISGLSYKDQKLYIHYYSFNTYLDFIIEGKFEEKNIYNFIKTLKEVDPFEWSFLYEDANRLYHKGKSRKKHIDKNRKW